jgi:dTDP-4-amino-4,6-dideoxygalactose transaminase
MERASQLSAGLAELDVLTPTPAKLDQRITAHAFHLFSMRYNAGVLHGLPRERFVAALQAEGLPVTSGYPYPIFKNDLFKKQRHVVHPCPAAEVYCEAAVWLPQNALLAEQRWIDNSLEAIRKVCGGASDLLAQPLTEIPSGGQALSPEQEDE